MLNNQKTDFSEKQSQYYQKIAVICILVIISFFICISFLDYFVLPKSKTSDVLSYYKIRTVQANKYSYNSATQIAYNYYTQKGFTFTTEEKSIFEDNLEIEHTSLFKYVTKVKSNKTDYSAELINDLKGLRFYLYCVFLFSIIISLKILLSDKSYSKLAFNNIICFNSFMLFLCGWIAYIY